MLGSVAGHSSSGGRLVFVQCCCQPAGSVTAAIVNLAILLQLAAWLARIQAALPPGAEDEIVLIEHLPGRRVHLQDFFWTGVEDAPSWLDPEQILTLYETRTVHHTATVYVPDQRPGEPGEDGSQVPDSRRPTGLDCASCIEPTPTMLDHEVDQNIGVLVGDDPGPRYWLLTVLKAGESVPPKVELRLARLYKAAFTRQQQRHLGLLPEIRTRKGHYPKRQIAPVDSNQTTPSALEIPETTTDSTSPNETSTIVPVPLPAPRNEPRDRTSSSAISLLHMRAVHIAKSKRTLPLLEAEEFEELGLKPILAAALEDADDLQPRNETSSNELGQTEHKRAQLRQSEIDVGLVQVRMQNMSLVEGGATRLIYTVHLGGKPVPAETAAKDMALLSAQEVALELGAPVIIQSEPLSRKRDAWLLIGAASAGFLLLTVVVVGLLIFTKRKRAQSAVAAPPNRRILGKDEEYAPTTPGIDNTAYTSETEGRTEGTSGHRRTTPGSLSRTPGSQDTIDADTRDISSENELENGRIGAQQQSANKWDTQDYADTVKKGVSSRRVQRANAIDRPRSADSIDSADGGNAASTTRLETLESLEKGFGAELEEATGSPHSYLSMPSCKQFPNMRSVEPLSKVLEPVVVKHLDLELDSPEMKIKDYDFKGNGNHYFARASSATKDPGVLGPIVWDLKRKRAVEGAAVVDAALPARTEADLEPGRVPHSGAVGRARRRLNELLEDSFGLFGARESKPPQSQSHSYSRSQQQQRTSERRAGAHDGGQGPLQWTAADNRGKSAHVSPVASPGTDLLTRPRTSLPTDASASAVGGVIPETGNTSRGAPRGAWGTRPLSAGPFHRPALPEVEVVRVLADGQLGPEDPAVPLIAAIKKELGKFTYD